MFFFVLSGFLIGGFLLDEVNTKGKISFIGFYERRVRRIFPALLFMLLVISFVALLALTPADLIQYSKSQISALFSLSNFYFWKQSSYFDTSNNLKPLLHTWSLSVEEQFYFFFPVLLYLIRKCNFNFRVSIVATIVLISVGLAQYLSVLKPVASFYLLPTRSFELLTGVLAALLLRHENFQLLLIKQLKPVASILSLLCIGLTLLLMCLPLSFFPLPSPGVYSLFICINIFALCILGDISSSSLGIRLLSSRPLVFIGLISYSLYLWHQPIFAFARYRSTYTLSEYEYICLLIITFFFGFVSWKFIETPLRNREKFSNKKIWILVGVGFLLLLITSLIFLLKSGLPERYSDSSLKLINMPLEGRVNAELCSGSRESKFEIDNICKLGDPNSNTPHYLLIGDSHASAIAPAFSHYLKVLGLSGFQATYLGCPPGLGIERVDNSFKCKKFNDDVLRFIQNNTEIKTIVIAARWALMTNMSAFNNGEGGQESPENPKYESNDSSAISSTAALVKKLQELDKKIILIYPIPEVGLNVPMTLHLTNTDISTPYKRFKIRVASAENQLDQIIGPNIYRVHPSIYLCDKKIERCFGSIDKIPLYYDDDHLSSYGAIFALKDLVNLFRSIEKSNTGLN